jgi:hypothetical protein
LLLLIDRVRFSGLLAFFHLPYLLQKMIFILTPFALCRILPTRKQVGGCALLLFIYAVLINVGYVLASYFVNENYTLSLSNLSNIILLLTTLLSSLTLFLGTAAILFNVKNPFKMRRVVFIYAVIYTAVVLYKEILSDILFPQEFNLMQIMRNSISIEEKIYAFLIIAIPALVIAREKKRG